MTPADMLLRPIVTGGSTTHPQLGPVKVRVSPTARRSSARWKQGCVQVVIPPGMSPAEVDRLIDMMAPRLRAMKPGAKFHDGMRLELPLLTFTLSARQFPKGQFIASPDSAGEKLRGITYPRRVNVTYGSDLDLTDPATAGSLSRFLANVAARAAGAELVRHAGAVASSLGVHPTKWTVSSGRRTLGSCSTAGAISLSRYTLFLPMELTDYVIRHELAHLSHHDHSAAFHRMLDDYCGGRKALLEKQLRTYDWPILR